MSFQAVRAVFEKPVISALAGLSTPVPCYVDNQAYTMPDAGKEFATVNLQFGQMTSQTLSGNLERLRGSLVIECYSAKNVGPARAQEMITPVIKALNGLNSCTGYPAAGAVGWVGDITGPAFFALDSSPFYMVRVSVAVSAKFEESITRTFDLMTDQVELPSGGRLAREIKASTYDVGLTHPVDGAVTQEDANQIFDSRLKALEAQNAELIALIAQHDASQGHDSGNY